MLVIINMIRSLGCLLLLMGDNVRCTGILNELGVSLDDAPVNETRCYGVFGCLELNSDWYDPILRPVNVFPLDENILDTTFDLYTCDNPVEGQKLSADNDDILKSNFNATRQTKLIIHGFIDTTLFTDWLQDMRQEMLAHEPVNVFVVDWNTGSIPPYTQATANTRLVGLQVAFFINHLEEKCGVNPADIHLIGHSLGAHIAGYAGEKIPCLGRITGLDPAGPYFQGMGTHVRLDPSDATFVDVIHTDGHLFGMTSPCGHIDFYPNNGTNQPGCTIVDSVTDTLSYTLTSPLALAMGDTVEEELVCNHFRAISLFNESINNSQCFFVGQNYSDYEGYLKVRFYPGMNVDVR